MAKLVVIDSLGFDEPKTQKMASVLKALGLDGDHDLGRHGGARCRGLQEWSQHRGVSVQPVRELNALSVLKPRRMLVTRAALDKIKDGTFNGGGVARSDGTSEVNTTKTK